MSWAQSVNEGYAALATRSPPHAATAADVCAGKCAKHSVAPGPGEGTSSPPELTWGLGEDGPLTAPQHLALATVRTGGI